MDTELKCNHLTCRKSLADKAVVTTCSHIFCIDCANELFSAARLCPACETSLTEPDDVVVCSLHPTNDYKTSVLSGLSPLLTLEICSRAISFWQYQIHQENSFQQAVLRSVSDKNAQLQKQLDNVIREANGEISLLNSKTAELERDLELERRKIRDLQEGSRERDREYQKLKAQYDKIKRKALLGPNNFVQEPASEPHLNKPGDFDTHSNKARSFGGNGANIGAVLDGMEANKIQRTPLVARTPTGFNFPQGPTWQQPNQAMNARMNMNRQQFPTDRSRRTSNNVSEHSENEVENMIAESRPQVTANRRSTVVSHNSWPNMQRNQQHAILPTKRSGNFRPPGSSKS